jgi:hypothetical protein
MSNSNHARAGALGSDGHHSDILGQSKLKSADWWETRDFLPGEKQFHHVTNGIKQVTGVRTLRKQATNRMLHSPVRRLSGVRPDAAFIAQVTAIRQQFEQRRREQRWILLPGQSIFLDRWDVLGVFMIAYTALFTPFEVAFLDGFNDISAWKNGRFLCNRLIDVFFLLDLLLQFFVAVRAPDGTPTHKYHLIGGGYIRDHRYVAWHYLISGWVRPLAGSDSSWRERAPSA